MAFNRRYQLLIECKYKTPKMVRKDLRLHLLKNPRHQGWCSFRRLTSPLALTAKKRPQHCCCGLEEGGDILSHQMAVPSALIGLTSLFGMGRGEPYCYNHLSFRSVFTLHNKLTHQKDANIVVLNKS